MTKTKAAPRKRVSRAVLEQHKLSAEQLEMAARAEVGVILRGCVHVLDEACGRISRYPDDAEEVLAVLPLVIRRLTGMHQQEAPAWRDRAYTAKAARKAWRDAGGEE